MLSLNRIEVDKVSYDYIANSNKQRSRYKDAIGGISSAITLLEETLLELNKISGVKEVENLKKQINDKISNLKKQKNRLTENRNVLPKLAEKLQNSNNV